MKHLKNYLITLLIVCILLSGSACLNLSGNAKAPHMSKRVYERPDEAAAFALIDEITDLCASSDNLDAVIKKRNLFFDEYYYKISTLSVIASINYDKDVSNEYWKEESVWIEGVARQISNRALELEKAIFSSPCADYFIEEYGQDYADYVLQAVTLTDEQLALHARISELEAQYMPLYNDEEATPEQMAALLKELVVTRNALARTVADENGEYYDNYLDYSYGQIYGREYTPEDAAEYSEAVRQSFRPIATQIHPYYNEYNPVYVPLAYVTEKNLLSFMPEIISATAPEMLDSWDYMTEHGLYDFTISNTKANTSYVTEFYEYGDAFMFLDTYGLLQYDLSTAIHEFGHYNEVFMSNPALEDADAGISYDLAETHSQALELLTLPAVESICSRYYPTNTQLFQSYAVNLIFNSVWAMLFNCAVDSFEYIIYNADEAQLTAEFISEAFTEELAYFFPLPSGYGYSDISHVFLAPGYCISYSVSMAFSYVVWASETPVENYLSVVEYGTGNFLSTVCEGTGLGYPLDPTVIESVTSSVTEYVTQTIITPQQ